MTTIKQAVMFKNVMQQTFDDMHKAMIRWLIVAAKLSDGEIAFITGVNRRTVRYVRDSMGLEPNHSPAKRAKLVTKILELR